jgi:hypothetical protein
MAAAKRIALLDEVEEDWFATSVIDLLSVGGSARAPVVEEEILLLK